MARSIFDKISAGKRASVAMNRSCAPGHSKAIGKLNDRIAIGKGEVSDYRQFNDMQRVLGLPIMVPMSNEEQEEYSRQNVIASSFDDGWRLRPAQADGGAYFDLYDGLFGPIGVGEGKTILTLHCAQIAWRKGKKRIMLLVPPEVMPQLVGHDLAEARTKIAMTYPIHVMGGRSLQERRRMAKRGMPGLYIMPYSLLSTEDTEENLIDIMPEVLIGDEAHRIANPSAARTRRVTGFIVQHKPQCVFLSGTVTSKSVRDYHHLIRAALRKNSPLPDSPSLAYHWGDVIDAEAGDWEKGDVQKDGEEGTGPLLPLVDWVREHFPHEKIDETQAGFRKAFSIRLNTAPGVVSSDGSELGCTLRISNQPITGARSVEGWSDLSKLITKVIEQWLTPNGDEIEHAIHTWKWLYELSAGFYNELIWPTVEAYAARKNITEGEAEDILERAKEYHATGQEYAKALRSWIERRSKPGLDTPFLIGRDMAQHGKQNVGAELYDVWRAHKSSDFEGRPDRDSRAVRVCSYKVDAVVAWAKKLPKGKGAIVWYMHQEVGRWITEALREAGVDVLHCPAGDAHNRSVGDKANKHRVLVASIRAHGTGKNLQHFDRQCVVQWPRQAKMAEQMLGRLHRFGQKADEVDTCTLNTLDFDHMNFAACLNDALYIHQTTSVRQKMIYANYNPPPRIFPPSVLRERGADGLKTLDRRMLQILRDKFDTPR